MPTRHRITFPSCLLILLSISCSAQINVSHQTETITFLGVDAYKKALEKAGNQHFRVELIPNADHNIILCKTGSMKERNSRSRREWQNYAPEYLDIMEKWLREF